VIIVIECFKKIFENKRVYYVGARGLVHPEPVPGHVHQGGDIHVDQPHRAQSAGKSSIIRMRNTYRY
jgi:hypothetical protein